MIRYLLDFESLLAAGIALPGLAIVLVVCAQSRARRVGDQK